jgi:uncharacterized surface protein with fasciclin (FAS1) repeats
MFRRTDTTMPASRRLVVWGAALALALAACGTDDPIEDSAAEDTAAPAATDTDVAVEMTEPTDAATTEDATADATDDPTDAATDMATDDPTDEATDAATDEATDAATDEATDDAADPTEAATEEPRLAAEGDTIVAALEASTGYAMLIAGLEQTGLAEELEGDGPFTVFAPSDTAFGFIPEDTLEGYMEDDERLTEILSYHVVEGEAVTSADLAAGDTLTTLAGAELTVIETQGGDLAVGGVPLAEPDVEVGNGVIHGVDAVLIPPRE